LGVVSHRLNPQPTPVKTRPSALDVSLFFSFFHTSYTFSWLKTRLLFHQITGIDVLIYSTRLPLTRIEQIMSASASTSTSIPAPAAGPSNQELNTPGESNDEKNSVVIKVGMVGDSQIGKTSLMVKYVEGSFDEDYIQTLGVNFMEKTISVVERPSLSPFGTWAASGSSSICYPLCVMTPSQSYLCSIYLENRL